MKDFPKKTIDDVPRLTVSGAIPPLPICLYGMHRDNFTIT